MKESIDDVGDVWNAWERCWVPMTPAASAEKERDRLWGMLMDWYQLREPETYDAIHALIGLGYGVYRSDGHYPPEQPIYAWYDAANVARNVGHFASNLPGRVYALLSRGKVAGRHHAYDHCRDAWEDGAQAIIMLEASGHPLIEPAEKETGAVGGG